MKKILFVMAIAMLLFGCDPGMNMETEKEAAEIVSLDEFMAKEVVPQENGTYLVEGDIAFDSLNEVNAYYNAITAENGRSTAYLYNGNRDVWNSTDRIDLTFCVSNNFGTTKDLVLDAMLESCSVWERYANIEFKYRADQDSNATTSNPNVKFILRPATTAEENANPSVAASAFYPHKYSKELIVYDNTYNDTYASAVSIITHELGHVLGLMHEHIWQWQNNQYVQVEETYDPGQLITAYDTGSIMFYSSKPGYTGNGRVTRLDIDGVQVLYGSNPLRATVFFNYDTSTVKMIALYDFRAFLRRHNEWTAQGYRIDRINAFVQNGEVKYSAIFKSSTAADQGVYGWTRTDFLNKYNTLSGQGWKLHTMDVFVLNGTELYTGVWRQSTVAETGILGWSRTDFINRYNTLSSQGYRLHLMSTFVLNGTELYTAFFRQSTASEQGVYGWTEGDFLTRYNTLSGQGYRLILMDTFRINGTTLYSGTFRTSSVGQSGILSWEFDDFERNYTDSQYPANYKAAIVSFH